MSVYTAYDMIAGCKSGAPEAPIHLARHFLPFMRKIHSHYGLAEPDVIEMKRQIGELEPMGEREIVSRLRPQLPIERQDLDLETFASALSDLTVTEKQIVWLDTMLYDPPDAARLTRVSPETAQKTRDKAADLLRRNLDSWSVRLLRENGSSLGIQARASKPAETIPFREYLELIDVPMTWQNRLIVEKALADSWYEIDHLCRAREADEAVRKSKPLSDGEVKPYLDRLGVSLPKPALWKRLLPQRK